MERRLAAIFAADVVGCSRPYETTMSRKPGVCYVVEGSVREGENRARIKRIARSVASAAQNTLGNPAGRARMARP